MIALVTLLALAQPDSMIVRTSSIARTREKLRQLKVDIENCTAMKKTALELGTQCERKRGDDAETLEDREDEIKALNRVIQSMVPEISAYERQHKSPDYVLVGVMTTSLAAICSMTGAGAGYLVKDDQDRGGRAVLGAGLGALTCGALTIGVAWWLAD